MTFPSPFNCFPIALVLRYIGNHPPIPQHLPCCPTVKAHICIKEGTGIVQSKALQIGEDVLELLFQLIAIIMLTCHYPRRGNDVPMRISYW